jgi:hypothetical protein
MITALGLIARRYEAIDRVVSSIWQNDACDKAFSVVGMRGALAEELQATYPIFADKVARPDDAATSWQVTQHDRVVEHLWTFA